MLNNDVSTHRENHMDFRYKTRSFYIVTSRSIHLKNNMTCGATYHFDETIFLLLKREK